MENDAKEIGRYLATKRKEAGLGVIEVCRRAGIDRSTLWRIEQGMIANPRADSLQFIAEAVGIPASDLLAEFGWVPPQELPTIRPYLRTKYRQLPDAAVREIEAHFDEVARRHGISFDRTDGPVDGEDE